MDFRQLPALAQVDEVYLALGTTIRVAGSQEAFRAVDYEANLAVATAAIASGARRIGLVSAADADARSSVFYLSAIDPFMPEPWHGHCWQRSRPRTAK